MNISQEESKYSQSHASEPTSSPFPERDESQRNVINLSAGHHLVLAPPGCGKTDILAERIVRALATGVNIKDMLCLTFTNRAARGMRQRIKKALEDTNITKLLERNVDVADLFVGNIHRFCSVFLFENRRVSMSTAILDEYDTYQIIQAILGEEEDTDIGYEEKERYKLVMDLQHLFFQISHNHDMKTILFKAENELAGSIRMELICKYTGWSPAELYNHIDEIQDKDLPSYLHLTAHYIRCAKQYEEYKTSIKALDFDDLLLKTYEELKNSKRKAKKYSWIQIDEVQDLNPLQFAIVDLLTDKSPKTQVVYLGDEQQAIFSFLGAKLSTLNWLKERCSGSIHHLEKNYRSPKYLLDIYNQFAVRILETDPDFLPQPHSQDAALPGDLVIDNSSIYPQDETKAALRYAADFVSMEKRHEDDQQRVAVLVPTNKDADAISDLFTKNGLAHFKISGKDVFSTPEIQTLFSHLTVMNFESNIIAWAKLFRQLKLFKSYSHPYSKSRQFAKGLKDYMLSPIDLLDYRGSSYLQELEKAYANELVIFDTETTGLDIYEDDIVQIAAMRIRNGKIAERFNIFLHTDKEIPPFLGEIENPLVKEYANPDNVKLGRNEGLRQFLDFVGDAPLLGHNVNYDYRILDYNLQRDCHITDFKDTHPSYFDSLKMARLVCPNLKSYKLKNLLIALNLEGENSHMADDDIVATKSVVDYCIEKFNKVKDRQTDFLQKNDGVISLFYASYKSIFDHTRKILYDRLPVDEKPAMVQELEYIYSQFRQQNIIGECKKLPYILRYFEQDIIQQEKEASLYEQLNNHVMELNTFKEADLCDSSVIKEKYFISTVHKAKGLEFENVIVFNAVEDVYPYYKSDTPELQREDARKLYVAISRAKIRLCILTCKHKRVYSKKRMEWFEFEAKPSRFLRNIQHFFQRIN